MARASGAARRWIEHLGLALDGPVDVDTQFILPSGKRPDIAIRTRNIQILVESKLGAGLPDIQVQDYLTYLGGLECRRVLVLLTQKPVSVKPQWLEWAMIRRQRSSQGAGRRWPRIGGLGAESLGGDFVQLLVREGFVKPSSFSESDWNAWNAGYKVLQRISTFLDELDPHMRRIDSSLKRGRAPALTERLTYRIWRGDSLEIGFGMGAAGGGELGDPQDDIPEVIAFVGNTQATLEEAAIAAETTAQDRNHWTYYLHESRGLFNDWPCISRRASLC